MTVSAKLDLSGLKLETLTGIKDSLARSMAVAGGKVIRDEAKMLAPLGPTGHLKAAIYLAYKDGESNGHQVVYSVTWNKRTAPHGHLIEFGHWQPYRVVKLANGDWLTTNERLPTPKWIPAKPFLRPAYDATKQRAVDAMIQRGKQRLPELLSGDEGNGD